MEWRDLVNDDSTRGSVSNDVQEQYLWIEGARKRRLLDQLNEVQNSICGLEVPEKEKVLQSECYLVLTNLF